MHGHLQTAQNLCEAGCGSTYLACGAVGVPRSAAENAGAADPLPRSSSELAGLAAGAADLSSPTPGAAPDDASSGDVPSAGAVILSS